MPRTFRLQSALADRQGPALLNANVSAATSSLLPTDERGASFWGDGLLDPTPQATVQATTVDAFCAAANIGHIDILKMDVHGFEHAVLQGACDMLAVQRVSLDYTKIIMCPSCQGQRKLREHLACYDGLGYGLVDFFNPVRRHGCLLQADASFFGQAAKGRPASPSMPAAGC